MFKSLKTTLLLSHTGIILLTNVVMASVFYYFMADALEKNQKDHFNLVNKHITESIASYLTHKSNLLEGIANGKEVMYYSDNFRTTALAAYLSDFHQNFPSFSFINRSGTEEVRINQGEITENVSDYKNLPLFVSAFSQPNRVIVYTDKPATFQKEPAIQMVIAKFHYFEDNFAGILTGILPYRDIANILHDVTVGQNGYIILHDQFHNSVRITHSPANELQITISKDDSLSEEINKEGNNDKAHFERKKLLGTDAYIYHTIIPQLHWSVMSVLPYEEFSADIQKLRKIMVALFLLFCLISALLSYFLAHGITTPLARLSKAAKIISKGNLNEIVHIKSNDEIGHLVASFNAMTNNLKQTTISRDYFNTILSSMQESLIVLGTEGTIQTVNNATTRMLGYFALELVGQPLRIVLKEDAVPGGCPFSKLTEEESVKECELIYLAKDGQQIPVLFSASPMKNSAGEVTGMVCLAVNISQRKKTEEALRQSETKLRELAITDELTALLNRRGFMTMAEKQLQVAKRKADNIFLMYADVDNLKWVNDNLGHSEGDQILRETADLLRRTFRHSDIISRLGGDEFAIMFIDPSDEKSILDRLEQNMRYANINPKRKFDLSMSTGVVRFNPENPQSIEELMNEADTLMYENKQKKKAG